MTTVSINNIEKLIKDNEHASFEELKEIFEASDIQVREVKDNLFVNLYLLVSENALTPLQIECNGLILEKNSNKIICMCQNKFNNIENYSEIEQLKTEYSQFRMEYSEDGTVIRLYYYNNNWYTATTKCINAKKSYWSSDKTFDDMFWEMFKVSSYNIDNLDIQCTYTFIIIHKDNRIVVNHQYNNLIYINSVNNVTKEENYTNYFYNDNFIHRTQHIEVVDNQIHYPLDNYFNPTKRGIIIKFLNAENNWKIYQYDFKEYNIIKDVRGNVPLIRMRYLELLNEPEKLAILEYNYSEYYMLFTMIKHCMNNLYKEIHQLYFNSHIKHSITITEDHRLYKCMKQLHGIHKKQNVIITLEEVKKKVDTLDKNVIKTLLNWADGGARKA